MLVVGRRDDYPSRAVFDAIAATTTVPMRWEEVDRPGFVAPGRRGIEASTSDLVAFVDDDAVPRIDWLSRLLEPLSDPRVVCVGGRIVEEGLRPVVHKDAGRVRWYGKYVGNVASRTDPSPVVVDGVSDANWIWRRSVISSLWYDERLDEDHAFLWGLDLCLQARARGWSIAYQSSAVVDHSSGPRDAHVGRGDRRQHAVVYARNYTLIALQRLKGPRRVAFVIWWWLVGDRGAYGLVTAAFDLLQGRTGVAQLCRAAMRGRTEGVRAFMAAPEQGRSGR